MSSNVRDEVTIAGFEDCRREAVQKILGQLAAGEEITEEQHELLFNSGLRDEKLETAIERRRAVERWRTQAGTFRERMEAADNLAKIEKQSSAELAELQRQRTEIDQRIEALNVAISNAKRQVERQTVAVEKLRDPFYLPEHTRRELDRRQSFIDRGSPNRQLLEKETAIRTARSALEMNDGDAILLYAEAAAKHLIIEREVNGFITRSVPVQSWAEYCDRLRADLPNQESEFAKLKERVDFERAQVDDLKNYWLDQ